MQDNSSCHLRFQVIRQKQQQWNNVNLICHLTSESCHCVKHLRNVSWVWRGQNNPVTILVWDFFSITRESHVHDSSWDSGSCVRIRFTHWAHIVHNWPSLIQCSLVPEARTCCSWPTVEYQPDCERDKDAYFARTNLRISQFEQVGEGAEWSGWPGVGPLTTFWGGNVERISA